MKKAGLALALFLAGCGQAPTQNLRQAPAPQANAAAPLVEQAMANASEAPIAAAPDPEALKDLSPFQRRAYEKGFQDCQAGRYEPDRWPEAYRIGCAAANDR